MITFHIGIVTGFPPLNYQVHTVTKLHRHLNHLKLPRQATHSNFVYLENSFFSIFFSLLFSTPDKERKVPATQFDAQTHSTTLGEVCAETYKHLVCVICCLSDNSIGTLETSHKIVCGHVLASFPGPARSSLAVRNSRRGPGNEASHVHLPPSPLSHTHTHTTYMSNNIHHFVLVYLCIILRVGEEGGW